MSKMFSSAVFAAAVSVFSVLAPAVQAQEFKWELAEEHPPTGMTAAIDKKLAEILAEKSNGRIGITIHYGGSIGFRAPEHLNMVGSNAIQLANTPIHTHGGTDSFFELGSLPFLARSSKDARILFELARDKYVEKLDRHNQMLLAVMAWPPVGFWSKNPMAKPEDMKGWTARTIDLNGQLTLRTAGAVPVNLPFSEIVPALSTNVIAGVMTSADAGANIELNQYLPYYTEVGYGWQWNTIHMNKDAFNALPADLQKLVIDTGNELTELGWQQVEEKVKLSYEKVKAKGVTLTTEIDPAFRDFLIAAGKPALDRWIERAGPEGKALIDAYNERIK